MNRLFIILALALTGCAVAPDKLRFLAQHDSHLTQHFGADQSDYGFNSLAVELHWQRGGWFADASEGVILNRRDTSVVGANCYGGMLGPREIFQARTGWEISLK